MIFLISRIKFKLQKEELKLTVIRTPNSFTILSYKSKIEISVLFDVPRRTKRAGL